MESHVKRWNDIHSIHIDCYSSNQTMEAMMNKPFKYFFRHLLNLLVNTENDIITTLCIEEAGHIWRGVSSGAYLAGSIKRGIFGRAYWARPSWGGKTGRTYWAGQSGQGILDGSFWADCLGKERCSGHVGRYDLSKEY